MGELKSYYNYDQLWSRNGTFNFVTGARGLGKTYGAKLFCIRNAIRNGDQFIYLRRYNTELAGKSTFFADIEHEFPGFEFRVNGNVAEYTVEGRKDWQVMGYFAALSKAQSYKSRAYPLVKTIIFDEFIIETGHIRYLKNEAKVFTDFYSTVDRYKDKTRVLFLANAISIVNPYFAKYDVVPREDSEWSTSGGGFVVAHFPRSDDFISEVEQTRFGQFIKQFDNDYSRYAVNSVFRDNTGDLVGNKPADAVYWFSILTDHGMYSVWRKSPMFYIQQKQPRQVVILTTDPMSVTPEIHLMATSDIVFVTLRNAYKYGQLIFDKPVSRASFVNSFRF